jgi:hypothetical protein
MQRQLRNVESTPDDKPSSLESEPSDVTADNGENDNQQLTF